MNKKGIGYIGATILIVAVLLMAFVGAWMLALVDTSSHGSGAASFGDILDPREPWAEGTIAVRMGITENVTVESVEIAILFNVDIDQTHGCYLMMDIRDWSNRPGVGTVRVLFEHISPITGTKGLTPHFTSTPITGDTNLATGIYKLESTMRCSNADVGYISWRAGEPNHGTSGFLDNGYWHDHDQDGEYTLWWGGDPEVPPYTARPLFIVLEGALDTGNGDNGDEEEEEEQQLVTTEKKEKPLDMATPTVLVAMGMIFLIIGIILIIAGMQSHWILQALGFIFVIIAMIMLGYGSYAIFTGGLVMAKRRRKKSRKKRTFVKPHYRKGKRGQPRHRVKGYYRKC